MAYDAYGAIIKYEKNIAQSDPTKERFSGKEYDTSGYVDGLATGMKLDYFGARYYDPEIGVWISCDAAEQLWNPYGYASNPVIFIDPDGNFLTWSIGKNGLSIGFNLTPIGIPLGAGINVGWGNGGSLGAYGEVGPRIGGTGCGVNATVQQSADYNFGHGSGWSSTTTESAGASFAYFNVGASSSQTFNFNSQSWRDSWAVSAGIGASAEDGTSLGYNVSYGSGGWSLGVGGSYDGLSATNSSFAEENQLANSDATNKYIGKRQSDWLISESNIIYENIIKQYDKGVEVGMVSRQGRNFFTRKSTLKYEIFCDGSANQVNSVITSKSQYAIHNHPAGSAPSSYDYNGAALLLSKYRCLRFGLYARGSFYGYQPTEKNSGVYWSY